MSIKKIWIKKFTSPVRLFVRPNFEFEKFKILDEKLSFECKVAWKWLVQVSGVFWGWEKRWNKKFQNLAIFLAILGHFFENFMNNMTVLNFLIIFYFVHIFHFFTYFCGLFAYFGQKIEFLPKLVMKNYLLKGKSHENG